MSHLLKDKKKIYFRVFKLCIFTSIFTLFFFGLINYNGNKFNYFSFSIVSNFLIYFGFRKKSIFFETFLCLLLWLGFWFKFTYIISFTDGIFREGVGIFDYTKKSFDKTLLVSQIGIISFIFAGYFRQLFLYNYPEKLIFKFKKKNFFNKNRKKIWLIFLLFFIIFCFMNFYFKIYQKGLMPDPEINFLVSGIFKWLLLFGFTSISAMIVFFEINTLKKFLFSSSLIIFFETFLSAFSMLSRGMIFNAGAILFGIYKFSNKVNQKSKINYYIKSVLIISFLFYLSVLSVNYIRANFFYTGNSTNYVIDKLEKKMNTKNSKKYSKLSHQNNEILYLLVNRWVGIDGVMAVISKKNILNFDFLKESFKENIELNTPTFYESMFDLDSINTTKQIDKNTKGNTLPGVIAFMYYSGSNYFLFFSIFIATLLSSFIEYFAFTVSGRNLIFSSVIGQIIAFRLIHFGYTPQNSYLFFGSIILTILMFFFIKLLVIKKSK